MIKKTILAVLLLLTGTAHATTYRVTPLGSPMSGQP